MAHPLQTTNYVQLTINSAVDTVQTTIDLVSAAGLPTLGASEYTIVMLERIVDNFKEIVRVDDITGNTLTVVRGQEGTTPLTFATGDPCRNYLTSGMFQESLDGSGVPDSTETVKGIARVATAAEATALTLDGIILSPSKLPSAFNGMFGGFGATGLHTQLDADANNITKNGIYNMNAGGAATSNLPTANADDWYFVAHDSHAGGATQGFQMAYGQSGTGATNRIFYRNKDVTFPAWTELTGRNSHTDANRKQGYALVVGAGATAAVTPQNLNGISTIVANTTKGEIVFNFTNAFASTDYSIGGVVFSEGSAARTFCVTSKLVGSFTIQVTGTSDGSDQWPDAVDFACSKNILV